MILFISSGSPFARIIRVMARDRGVAMQEQEVTLRDPASALLPHSAPGRVPVLLDGGEAISEVPLILAHLGWLPANAPSLARLGRALALLDAIGVWNRDLRRPVHERSPTVHALERTRTGRILDGLDLAAHDPLSVEGVTLACALGYCERRHTVFAWREGRAALAAWYDAAVARPAFAETVPPLSGI